MGTHAPERRISGGTKALERRTSGSGALHSWGKPPSHSGDTTEFFFDEEIGPEPYRFMVLGIFCVGSFGSALAWLGLVPIADIAGARFDVGPGAINVLANMFMILFIPGSVLSLWIVERYGLARNILCGIGFNLLSAVAKYVGCMLPPPQLAYAVVVLGQVIGSFGQPCLTMVAARLSMDWFPESERDIATTAAVMGNIFGQMVASFAPALIVSEEADLPKIMVYQLYMSAVLITFALAYLEERPKHPPSPAAAVQWTSRLAAAQRSAALGEDRSWAAFRSAGNEVRTVLQNSNFMFLVMGFAIGTGAAWTVLILEEQIVTPCGYTDVSAGTDGAASIGVGIVAAFILASIMESTKAYVIIQKVDMVAGLAGVILVFAMNRPDNRNGILAAWCVLGATLQPLMPLTIEHAAEMTFPITAETSTAVLLGFANIISMVMIFVVTPLLQMPVSEKCESIITPASIVVIAIMLVGLSFTMAVQKDYRRQEAEHGDSERRKEFLLDSAKAAAAAGGLWGENLEPSGGVTGGITDHGDSSPEPSTPLLSAAYGPGPGGYSSTDTLEH